MKMCATLPVPVAVMQRLLLVAAAVSSLAIFAECVATTAGFLDGWKPATATWYGAADGAGSDGGACGYGPLIGTPYGRLVTAGSSPLFQGGLGCGACYKVKCFIPRVCAAKAVRVVITDECPGGLCAGGNTHFDLSGSAFARMANTGFGQPLLNAGVVPLLYKRVPCAYRKPMRFEVAAGSSPFWFSVLIKYVRGSGDLKTVELRQAGQAKWIPMEHIWGANWCVNGGPLKGPFAIRLTSLLTGQAIVATGAIPGNWAPATSYVASVNFPGV